MSPSTGAFAKKFRANLRVIIKGILRKYGNPPDMQWKATETVLEQAGLLAGGWGS